jgi:thioredoxin reductase
MHDFDVLVVGGGAAGLTAALVLLRARRSVALVDAGAPRNAPASRMHGFLARDGSDPKDLLAEGRAEVARYGSVLIDDVVSHVAPGFDARLAGGGRLTARRVLIATGLRDELPDIPGVRERWGRDVLHCPYCHGYEVQDQVLGVVGGTPEAVQHAVLIRQWSADVTLFPHEDTLDDEQREVLAARGVRVVHGRVAQLLVDSDGLHAIELEDGRAIPVEAVFVRPRFVPNSGLVLQLGCEVDQDGWPTHDATGRTSVPSVWVAGNAADPRAQAITAAGQGSAAAIALNADLVAEETEQALREYRAAPAPHAPSELH